MQDQFAPLIALAPLAGPLSSNHIGGNPLSPAGREEQPVLITSISTHIEGSKYHAIYARGCVIPPERPPLDRRKSGNLRQFGPL